jgi:hypothetical protein
MGRPAGDRHPKTSGNHHGFRAPCRHFADILTGGVIGVGDVVSSL